MRDQTIRDQQDSEREHSPLRAAPDSIELDSTDRPIEDVVRQIVGFVREERGGGRSRSRAGSGSGRPGNGSS
jgi:cytidylate kinase